VDRRSIAAVLCPLALGLLSSGLLRAQSTPPARPQFDVASVKPNKRSDGLLSLDVQTGGRFIATNIPLKQFIRAAYTLQLYQIVGEPGWVDDERFDIIATSEQELRVPTPWMPGSKYALFQMMMQSLLADRFKMVSHNETRESPVYALVVDKPERGPSAGVKNAAVPCAPDCGMHIGRGSLRARRVPMPTLAEFLSQVTGRLVSDATGLTGNFDLDLQWNADIQQQASTDAPSIFTALQEQLGLRLDSRRGPVPVLVIDSIEHPTAD